MHRASVGWVWAIGAALGCAPPQAELPEAARQLTLLHTSDLHSRVWPFPERISGFEAELGLGQAGELVEVGGFARLAFAVEQERRKGPALWLDSGDALEGAEVFERFGGRLELELLSRFGLAAMALGNHELSLAQSELAAALSAAGFPVLAANALPLPATALSGRLHTGVVLEAEGLKLGVVGVANPSSPPHLARPDNPWALELAGDTATAVQLALDELMPRADLLVVLSHLGQEADRELVRSTTGIDLLLGGHQHLITAEPEWQRDCAGAAARERGCVPRDVPIVHSGSYGKVLTRLQLSLGAEPGGGFGLAALELSVLPLGGGAPEHAEVVAQLERLAPPAEPLGFLPEGLARHSALAGDSPLGNLVVDAMQAGTGVDVVLLNTSGLRADLEPGLLLRSDVELAFPFAEPWLTVWATGRELRQGLQSAARRSAARECTSVLQVAGLRLRIDCTACASSRPCTSVERLLAWGEVPLADDELLRLLLPAYLALPGADFAALAAGSEPLPVSVPQALERYFAGLERARGSACVAALQGLTLERCRQVFGERACPLVRRRAAAWCDGLPQVGGGRDGRIQMQR